MWQRVGCRLDAIEATPRIAQLATTARGTPDPPLAHQLLGMSSGAGVRRTWARSSEIRFPVPLAPRCCPDLLAAREMSQSCR